MVAEFSTAAKSKWKGAMKLLSIFGIGFNSSKCKTMAKMTVARIKLLRNKRQAVVRQMRHDIAFLLQSGQDATARIRVEHVIREQNIMAANEILELFCELVVARMSIISKTRQCPADLKEGISSLIFAAPRCSDIPELQAIRDIFQKKFGKDFVSAATDLRPSCGVNRLLIEKLSVRPPSGEMKLKIMKEIAKEHQVSWDYSESEMELLTSEELIKGSNAFVSASSTPVNPKEAQPYSTESNTTRPLVDGCRGRQSRQNAAYAQYDNLEAAAEAAAEAAHIAITAAEAAAYLANNKETKNVSRRHTIHNTSNVNSSSKTEVLSQLPRDRSFGSNHRSPFTPCEEDVVRSGNNNPGAYSDIKFDDSGSDDEESEDGTPQRGYGRFDSAPSRPPPGIPTSCNPKNQNSGAHTHPNLPDYDSLAARFEALKYRGNK